jgi:hypothetical protein
MDEFVSNTEMADLSALNHDVVKHDEAMKNTFLTRQPKKSANGSDKSDKYRGIEVDIDVVSYAYGPDFSAAD